MGRFGISEIVLIFFILILFFGARKLPEIARSLGESIKEFKKSVSAKGENSQSKQKKDG